MEEDNQATSHKDQKNRSYPLQFKLDALPFAQIHGNRTAERKFNVDRKDDENGERKQKELKKL